MSSSIATGLVRLCAIALVAAPLAACGGDTEGRAADDDGGSGDAGPGDGPDGGGPNDGDPADRGCPDLFAQDRLPEYRVEIDDDEWTALEDEFLHRRRRIDQGLEPAPYHPIGLAFEGAEIAGAMLRLKGSTSWQMAVDDDPDPKMQFVIAFNEVDPAARFHGVRKVELDMPRSDRSFLRQRLALYYMRSTGLEAQCANSARLVINGEYYGLYTHLERPDKEFLQRQFPDADDGDLWEGGRDIKTNEDTFTWDRLAAFWEADTVAEVEAVADLDGAVREWATEAMIPHADGYYMGRPNFYLYDHPTRGFVWLPHDLDSAFDYVPADTPPLHVPCEGCTENDRQHFAIVLGDDGWLGRYQDELGAAREGYAPDELVRRIDAWAAQIAEAAADDPMKPFDDAEHDEAIASLRGFPAERAAAVDAWLECREAGPGGPDRDDDGIPDCDDCAPDDDAVPRGTERCDGRDDDCDLQIDEGACG